MNNVFRPDSGFNSRGGGSFKSTRAGSRGGFRGGFRGGRGGFRGGRGGGFGDRNISEKEGSAKPFKTR